MPGNNTGGEAGPYTSPLHLLSTCIVVGAGWRERKGHHSSLREGKQGGPGRRGREHTKCCGGQGDGKEQRQVRSGGNKVLCSYTFCELNGEESEASCIHKWWGCGGVGGRGIGAGLTCACVYMCRCGCMCICESVRVVCSKTVSLYIYVYLYIYHFFCIYQLGAPCIPELIPQQRVTHQRIVPGKTLVN